MTPPPSAPAPLTQGQIKAIRSLRDSSWTWKQIAEAFGLSVDRLRRQADPDYRDRQNSNAADRKRRRKFGEQQYVSKSKEPTIPLRPDWSPPDTLVGLLMGDPAPERSALAHKNNKSHDQHPQDHRHRLAQHRHTG